MVQEVYYERTAGGEEMKLNIDIDRKKEGGEKAIDEWVRFFWASAKLVYFVFGMFFITCIMIVWNRVLGQPYPLWAAVWAAYAQGYIEDGWYDEITGEDDA